MNELRIPLQRPVPASDALPPSGSASEATESGWGRVLAVSFSRAALAMVVGLLVWSVLPLAVGWTPRAIMSGSMEPRIHVGDVVVGRPVDPAQLVKDQVVTVTDPDHPEKTRTHRLLRRDAQGRLVLKGDANPQPDSTPVQPSAVLGLGVVRVPYVARPVYWWATRDFAPLGITVALLVLAGITAASPLTIRRPAQDSTESDGSGPPDDTDDHTGDHTGDDLTGGEPVEEKVGLGILTPGTRPVPAVPARRRRRVLLSLVAALAASSVMGVTAPTYAAYARTTSNGSNSWKAATDFRPYRTAVLADSPYLFWRLDETSGTAVDDETASNRDGTLIGSSYTWAQPGALASEAGERSLALSVAVLNANTSVAGPTRFSVEAWIKTTTTSGGRVLGFGNQTGQTASTTVDRQLYIGANGRAYFGIGSNRVVVASSAAVNDGKWHHLVGTYTTGNGGMVLYVDGVQQGTSQATTQSFTGWWRAGAEQMSSWTSNPDAYFEGNLEELAVYSTNLSAARVKAHYDAGVTP